jgi:hypothetical protein
MPVLVGACQATALQSQDDTDLIESDLCQQRLKAGPVLGRGTAVALVFVNASNAFAGPAEQDGPLGEGILAFGGLTVMDLILSKDR